MVFGLTMLLLGCDTEGPTIEDHTFQRVLSAESTINTEGRAVAEVPGGGYMIAGRDLGNSIRSGRVYVAKTDKRGELLWKKLYNEQSATDGGGYDIIRTKDGSYVITGKVSDKLYLLKIDSDGNPLWEHRYNRLNSGPEISKSDIGFGLTKIEDGGFAIVGQTLVPVGQTGEGWLAPSMLRVDSQGNNIWFKAYRDVVDRGDAYAVAEKTGRKLHVVGRPYFQFETTTDDGALVTHANKGDISYEDIKCIKSNNVCVAIGRDVHSDKITVTKTQGEDIVWSKTLGVGIAKALTITQDGGIVGVGARNDPDTGERASYLFKLDANGKLMWDRFADDRYSGELFDVIETAAGDIIATGQTTHYRKGHINSVIVRTTANGRLQ